MCHLQGITAKDRCGGCLFFGGVSAALFGVSCCRGHSGYAGAGDFKGHWSILASNLCDNVQLWPVSDWQGGMFHQRGHCQLCPWMIKGTLTVQFLNDIYISLIRIEDDSNFRAEDNRQR